MQQLTPREVFDRMTDTGKAAPILLDVREESEVAVCRIDGCLHVPMRAVPSSLHLLPADAEIVVYCHHGMRSQQVAHFLGRNGFTVANLQGGIEAWAREVAPGMPRY